MTIARPSSSGVRRKRLEQHDRTRWRFERVAGTTRQPRDRLQSEEQTGAVDDSEPGDVLGRQVTPTTPRVDAGDRRPHGVSPRRSTRYDDRVLPLVNVTVSRWNRRCSQVTEARPDRRAGAPRRTAWTAAERRRRAHRRHAAGRPTPGRRRSSGSGKRSDGSMGRPSTESLTIVNLTVWSFHARPRRTPAGRAPDTARQPGTRTSPVRESTARARPGRRAGPTRAGQAPRAHLPLSERMSRPVSRILSSPK